MRLGKEKKTSMVDWSTEEDILMKALTMDMTNFCAFGHQRATIKAGWMLVGSASRIDHKPATDIQPAAFVRREGTPGCPGPGKMDNTDHRPGYRDLVILLQMRSLAELPIFPRIFLTWLGIPIGIHGLDFFFYQVSEPRSSRPPGECLARLGPSGRHPVSESLRRSILCSRGSASWPILAPLHRLAPGQGRPH